MRPSFDSASVAVCLLMVAGCGSGILSPIAVSSPITPTSPTAPTAPTPAIPQPYHSYGASITYGFTLANPATQSYPALVAADESLVLTNHAIPGDQSCDLPKRQIFPNGDSPSLKLPSKYSMQVGTNDVDIKGTGAYEAIYSLCQQATISWLALPLEYKSLATGTSITTTGGGSLDTTNGWNAWVTAGQGSTVSFAITTASIGPIYAWPRIDDNNPGTWTYALDGTVLGTGSTQTSPRIATLNGSTDSLGFLRIPAVPAGAHIVTFTQTSSAAGGLSIVGIGAPPAKPAGTLPEVLVGNIPFQLHGPYPYACTVTDAPCLQYNQDIKANVALFKGDGLDVRFFDTRRYMFGTASEMNDAVHPNAFGHIELSHSVEAVI